MNYEAAAAEASYLMTLCLIPMGVFYWCRAVLTGHEKMEYMAYARFLENVVKVSGGLTLLILGYGVFHLIILIILSKTIGAMAMLFFARKHTIITKLRWELSTLKSMIRHIPVFFVTTIFNSMFWATPIIILSKIGGVDACGIYSAAYKLVDILVCVSAAFGQAVFPVISRISTQSMELFRTVCMKSMKLVTIITIAIAAGGTLLADKIIPLIYGADMHAAIPVLQILIWSIVPFGIVPTLAYALVSRNLQKFDMVSNICAFISILSFTIIFTTMYGVTGTAIATLTATVVFSVVQVYYIHKYLFPISILLPFGKPLFAAAIMSLLLFIFRDNNIFALVMCGAAVYLGIILATGTVSTSDRRLYRQLRALK